MIKKFLIKIGFIVAPHECNFVKPYYHHGKLTDLVQCDFKGCKRCDDPNLDAWIKASNDRIKEKIDRLNEVRVQIGLKPIE